MNFFQAFPLSLSILWRFALVLPVLLIGLFLYGFVGGLIGFVLGFILPGVNYVVLFAVSASSGIIPILIGTRMGFAAKQIWPSGRMHKLILPALVYGAVEALAICLILAPGYGLFAVSVLPEFESLAQSLNTNPELAAGMLNSPAALLGLGMMLATFVVICAVRACLLVPIASASIGRDPDDRAYTPFRHFGAAFLSLFALVAVSYLGMFLIYTLVFAVTIISGMSAMIMTQWLEVVAMFDGSAPWRPIWSLIAFFIVYLLIAFWAFSLQCAGGVLGHLSLGGPRSTSSAASDSEFAHAAPHPASDSGPRLSADELRALRKSRQTGQS